MTKRKSDGGPERRDGEAQGVSGGEPKPPGEGWWRMWGDGSCLPEMGQVVEMWRRDWKGIRRIDESLERFSCEGIWWRPLKADQGSSQDDPCPLPSWARQPMIDSGPAPEKPRIVHAWHTDVGTLFTLGSNGRIHRRDSYGDWHEITAYPPGLEP